ncbi:anti-sigma factor [Cryobacterium sp. PH29-G1]|uniref:anti-sigma factor n=1 Tax=Cryobacterium sp. PH29-G1 TaxID=3046211 RepID=UPI0024BA96E1|nr:anti-sigma factor [Cryobacterium sp. PH29-G1]MDJ0348043.1 anti-sigma factor [Cryobacterium sp. PH29-G1]
MTPTEAARTSADPVHIEPVDLQLLALAERDATARERAHLAECAACSVELGALRRVVNIGRVAGSDRVLTPPAQVWAGIHAELGLSDAVRTAPIAAVPVTVVPVAAVPVGKAPVRLLSRRRWVPLAVAAGVIGLVGGIAIGVAATTSGAPRDRVIAEATLDALPGWTASGSALVEVADDGRRSVVVDLDAPNSTSPSLREVWLLKVDASGLVSVGFLDGSTGRFTIPASVDLAQYPLVDVSAEPADGDPAHSGDSIVRGRLHAL